MPQLHYFPGNASLTPHILLEELGVPFELKFVDRKNGAHKTTEYLKLNPNGLIPVLVDGDLTLYETAAIALHLVDKYPEARLAPAIGSGERAHFYKWLVWLTNTLQASLIVYFYPERYVNDGDADAAAAIKINMQKKIGAYLRQLDDQLRSHGEDWILGANYSVVDIYTFMLCRWTRVFEGAAAKPAREFSQLGPFL
jgi:glutathione S-transferase